MKALCLVLLVACRVNPPRVVAVVANPPVEKPRCDLTFVPPLPEPPVWPDGAEDVWRRVYLHRRAWVDWEAHIRALDTAIREAHECLDRLSSAR
jgi:hypothetical protein